MTVVQPLALSHVSLHFDGIRISDALDCATDEFCDRCSVVIERVTGFAVKIRQKVHRTFLEMVAHRSTQTTVLPKVNQCLLLDGNCIPCALSHLVALPAGKLTEIENPRSPSSIVAATRRARSYSETAGDWKIELETLLGMHISQPGLYIVHSEDLGKPHCIAVKCAGDDCTVINGATEYSLKTSDFMACSDSAIDRQTIVTFIVSTAPIPVPAELHAPPEVRKLLLELQAGAGRASGRARLDGDLVTDFIGGEDGDDDGDDDGQSPFVPAVIGNDSVVAVGDQLLQFLPAEVGTAVRSISKQRRPAGKSIICHFCPFRSFQSKDRLLHHLRAHHTLRHQYVCSGTKQIKFITALWDNDCSVVGSVGTDYIARIVAH